MNPMIKLSVVFAFTIFLAGCSTVGNPHAKVFDVRQFGAAGDGKTLDTAAIQKALDECGQSGGGVVEIPAGIYLSKPIFLRNKTALHLDAGAVLQRSEEHTSELQ